MANVRPTSRGLQRYGFALGVVAGWVVAWGLGRHDVSGAREAVEAVILRVLAGFPAAEVYAARALGTLEDGLLMTFGLTLFVATLAAPLGAVARVLAHARVRAGQADPLARATAWTGARPRTTTTLLSVLPAAFQLWFASIQLGFHGALGPAIVAVAALMGYAQVRVARAGLRTLLAPLGAELAPAEREVDPEEIRFDAVAVTRETNAAVGAVAALTALVVGWLCAVPVQRLFSDRHVFWAIGGYVAMAAAAAFVFQRASRIRVGVDGVYVSGTSRARFFAYRDLDEVREAGTDLELLRGGRVVLRLQLHGDDAGRRAAIAARIEAGVARVAAVRREGAAHFVTATSSRAVARSARGGADYRVASVSRDALWSLVEGAGVDDQARTAAARALAEAAGQDDRARLRVAALRCADPRVRVSLEEIALEDEAPAGAPRAQAASRPAPLPNR